MKTRKKHTRDTLLSIVFAAVALCFHPAKSEAGQMDVLLNKLVEKEILTRYEADELLEEARAEARKEMKVAKNEESPKWAQRIQLKGDLRLRYQHEQGHQMNENTDRGRMRFRLGATAFVTDEFFVHAGVATGAADPRSTNDTFDDNFNPKSITVDYAYAEYKPTAPGWDFLTVKGGKIKEMPIWRPADLLWDTDINPEGGSLEMVWDGVIGDGALDLFFNTGVFVLEDFVSSSVKRDDPFMYVVQPGFNWDITNEIHWKNAVTYYGFEEQKHSAYFTAPGIGRTNSTTTGAAGGVPMYSYDSIGVGSELAFDQLVDGWPRIALLGEFVNSFDPGRRNKGWLAGVKIGKEKIKKKGDWQFYYNYRHLEQDAWPDIFPDSDFYTGATDVEGHEVALQYGLRDAITLGLDYYYAQPISDGSTNPTFTSAFGEEHLLQADVVFAF